MSSGSLVIRLSPSRLEAAVMSRHGVAERGTIVALDPADWEAAWKHELKTLDATLRSVVTELDAAGASTSLFHDGPELFVSVFSCGGSTSDATAAARLALTEQAPFPVDENPHAIIRLGASGTPRQMHFLFAADSDKSARTLSAWLSRAGLTARRITPTDAAIIRHFAHQAAKHNEKSSRLMLRLGEQSCAIAGAAGSSKRNGGGAGGLLFLRRVALSIDTLTEALTRPITPRANPASSPMTLSRDEARKLLFTVGIPEPTETIEGFPGLVGADVLPSLQPVLQRFVVELKQSLRFNFPEESRASAALQLVGPGASIPRLGELLAAQIEAPLVPLDSAAKFDPFVPASPAGDLPDACQGAGADTNLLPLAMVSARTEGALTRALWIGAAAAVVVAGADSVLTWRSLTETTREADRLEATAQEVKTLIELRDKTIDHRSKLNRLEHAIFAATGPCAEWTAVFHELLLKTPEPIRLYGVSVARPKTGPSATIDGYIFENESGPTDEGITAFVDTLRESPLFSAVTLGATQRAGADGRAALQFALTLSLQSTANQVVSAENTDAADREATP